MSSGAERQARRDMIRFTVGLVVLAVFGGVAFLVATASGGFPLTPRTSVQAAFTNVDALQAGDEVRQNSKRIGQVSALRFENGRAVVTMEIEGRPDVYADATAAVWDFSALGSKVVEFRPGTPGAGPLGDRVIDGDRTTPSSDIYEVLNVFDEPTSANAQQMIQQLGGGLAGGGRDLNDFLAGSPDMLNDIGQMSSALAAPEAELPALLSQANDLSRRFAGRQDQIASLTAQAADTFDALAVDGSTPLRDTVRTLPETLDRANTSFQALNQPLEDTRAAMTALEPGSAALARSEEDLRGFLRESPPALDRVPGVAEVAEPAVEDLRATFTDARPLAPPVVNALTDLATPLSALAPYAPEAGQLFVRGDSFVSEGTALPGTHYARLTVAPNAATVTDGIARTPLVKPRNPYPTPGQADQDRAGLDGDRPLIGEGQ